MFNFNPNRLPSMTSLVAFEAAARHGSFTAAAEELNLSQSAVSRQIQSLEKHCGISLFDRGNQKVYLNEHGSILLSSVREALDCLFVFASPKENAIKLEYCLNIAILPSICRVWLIPMLPSFTNLNHNIHFNMITPAGNLMIEKEGVDIAITVKGETRNGIICETLFDINWVAVVSPNLVNQQIFRKPSDIFRFPLISALSSECCWESWCSANKITSLRKKEIARFEYIDGLIEAAIVGLGVALVPDFLVKNELRSGKLLLIDVEQKHVKETLYISYPKRRANWHPLRVFIEWLQQQKGKSYD